ncbi:MAG: helicase, partial [Clostridia bacterium]|nr:helicase [Clostridia bacterium]
MGNKDLYVLLNLLRPDLVIDRDTFEHMVEPNPFINEAVVSIRTQKENWQKSAISSLGSAAETNWGRSILKENPEFKEIIALLQTKEISQETRIRLITQTENLNSLSGIINRTRRRDIGDFTLRDPYTIEVAFTQFQQEIHDEVLAIQATKMSLLHGDGMIRFLLSTIRRQVSSCLFGLAPFLQDILSRHMEELGSLDDEEAFDTDESTFVQELDDRIKMLLKKVETLPPEDPKFDRLLDIIKKRQKLVNNKTMIFSSFIHTLTYLHKKLGRESVRMGLIKGATEDEERLKLRNRFSLPKEDPDAIDILLFSEVGSEGLDYQFCDCMINYDLPWNPMRIEQRIGRIDRNGQKSEKVSIYNFIIPGTIDAE